MQLTETLRLFITLTESRGTLLTHTHSVCTRMEEEEKKEEEEWQSEPVSFVVLVPPGEKKRI